MDGPVRGPVPRTLPGRLAGLVGVVAVLALVAGLSFWWGGRQAAPEPAVSATPSAEPTPLTPAEVSAQLAPSLVAIEVERAAGSDEEATGSGLVVAEDASILTALHVVTGASRIRVRFADGTTTEAEVTTAEKAMDIAVLRPRRPPSLVVPAILGTSRQLEVGSPVVAIGNPLGLNATTTSGVVSGLDRSGPGPEGVQLNGLIQFDAAVNPGSSGGPLVDSTGAVVGVVVALVNPTGDRTFIGIGLAVPIGQALGGGQGPQK